MFFNGKLLKDPKKLLVENGPNSQSAMRLEFTSARQIKKQTKIIQSYIHEAIKIEQSGLKIETKKPKLNYPTELLYFFKKDPQLKSAFEKLTPGRQRGYLLFFGGAKQSETRINRIEKYKDKIKTGKGRQD